MKRRTFVAAAGAGIASVLGTGAFNYERATRSVSVEVAADRRANLTLEQLGGQNGGVLGRSSYVGSPSRVMFEIPGDGADETQEADGIGTDSIYRFGHLVRITNRGSVTVAVHSEYQGDTFADLAIYDDDTDTGPLKADGPKVVLSPGDDFVAGLYIDSTGASVKQEPYREAVSIVATET